MLKVRENESSCPYQNNTTCDASLWNAQIDEKKKAQYCNSDNHDNCSLFLAKCLRLCSGEFENQKVYFAHV